MAELSTRQARPKFVPKPDRSRTSYLSKEKTPAQKAALAAKAALKLQAARQARWEVERDSLRGLIEARHLSVSETARRAGILPSSLFNFFAGRTFGLSVTTWMALGRVFPDKTIPEIQGHVVPGSPVNRLLPISGELGHDRWHKGAGVDAGRPQLVTVPQLDGLVADEALRLVDDHFDLEYRRGSLVFIEHLKRSDRLQAGDKLVVRRSLPFKGTEITLRLVEAQPDGSLALVFRTANPEINRPGRGRQVPIQPTTRSGMWSNGRSTYQVLGRVSLVLMPEALDQGRAKPA